MLDVGLLRPEAPRRIARTEYDQMVEMGLFGEERVELLHGVIVTMAPNHPPHASPVQLLNTILLPPLLGRAIVRVQLPLLATGESEPEPDLAIVPIGDYSKAHPDKAFLVIEVADSSVRKDRLVKGPLYAASGFEEYWLFDVQGRSVEVHRGPVSGGWTSITRHGHDETIHPAAFPDVAVRIASVL